MKISINDIIKYTEGKVCCNTGVLDGRQSYVTSISSNSREITAGALFLAIKGERVDGHTFLESAFENGAVAALVTEDIDEDRIKAGCVCIKVNEIIPAIQKLAAWYRRTFDIPVVAISGSVGKTTTKEMIAAALGGGKKVFKTEGNMNSQLGVALMMLRLTEDYDIAVIEMGISEPDEMNKLSYVAMPEMAVVTNIGVSHIAQLGSRENIRKEKLDIISGFKDRKGTLLVPGNDTLLNADDAFCGEALSEAAFEVMKNTECIRFGEDEKCAYRAVDIHNEGDGVVFTALLPDGSRKNVTLSVLGKHNVYNALAALAICDRYNVNIEDAIKGLESYKPIAMRGQIYENKGITIIDDTYNASPDSMKSGLSVLWEKECAGKRIAVLADVLELGEASEALHREIGAYIAGKYNEGTKTDILYTVGAGASYIAEEAKKNIEGENAGIIIDAFETKEDMIPCLKEKLVSGDLVMLKGSRGMQMDKVCEVLKNM